MFTAILLLCCAQPPLIAPAEQFIHVCRSILQKSFLCCSFVTRLVYIASCTAPFHQQLAHTLLFVSEQTEIQATDALMLDQQFVTGPLDSWLTSFVAWAENSTDYRCALCRKGSSIVSPCLPWDLTSFFCFADFWAPCLERTAVFFFKC